MTSIEENKLIKIHNAIHSKAKSVEIDDEEYFVKQNDTNLCRYVDYGGVQYMEQNAFKVSKAAELARQGHKITWGIKPGKWIMIVDGRVSE